MDLFSHVFHLCHLDLFVTTFFFARTCIFGDQYLCMCFFKSACLHSSEATLFEEVSLSSLLNMISAADIRSMVVDLAAVGDDMDPEQVQCVHKTCAIIEDMTMDKAKRLVSSAGDKACLSVFQSDGWSTDIRTRDSSFVGKVSVSRTGRLRTEFAMQRSIIKAKDQHGVMNCVVVLARPRCLGGKKCADLWSAAIEFFPMLKLLGHSGISLSVYLQDGLFAKPFAKRMLGRHDMFFDRAHFPFSSQQVDRQVAELRDWCFTWHCVAHSCSLALKWGLAPLALGEEFTEGVHVSVSGLLRASTGLLVSVKEFIGRYVAFDLVEVADPADLEFLWSYLDVPPKLLPVFCRVCPQWKGNRLHVRASLVNDVDGIDAITVCIKHCMRWCDFSDTRWTKVGECGRLVMKSLLVGIDGIVSIACTNSAVTKWHLNGWIKRASSSVRLYLGVASVAARATESMLVDLMEDDRFLIHQAKCWEIMQDELDLVRNAPSHFWETLGDVLGVDPVAFKGHVLESVVTSIGYMHMDVWRPLQQPPWCYCLGDIHLNVEALKAAPDVEDHTAAKMQMLARLGFEAEVSSALELLKQTSLTTIMVEQAHGSGAQLMSRHPQVGASVMTSRMLVHNSRLLFAPSHFHKLEVRYQSRIAELDHAIKSADSYTSARNAFLKMMVAHMKASCGSVGSPSHFALRKAVFQQHAVCFASLSAEYKDVCEKEAGKGKRRKIDTLSNERHHVQGQLDLLRSRQLEVDRTLGPSNHLDSQRFALEDLSIFAHKWAEYQPRDWTNRLLPPPSAIPAALEMLLSTFMTPHDKAPAAPVPWVSALVVNRDYFQGCGLYPAVATMWFYEAYLFSQTVFAY